MSVIQHYTVHYVQNRQLRKRSRGRVGQVKEPGKELSVESERCDAELCGLEPGTVYRIIVQAVEGITDYSYDEDLRARTARRIQQSAVPLKYNKCTFLDSQNTTGKDPARGRVRHLKGFRVEVNGRVYARLAANKTNITLKKCKSAMKYTCVVVVMTCPDKSDVHQRKSATPDTAVSDTDTDEENTKSLSDCFEESASDPVEVTLPRQDWGVSLSVNYCANKPAGSLRDSPCSDSGEEEGGVVARWKLTELAGDVSGYRLVWNSSEHKDRKEVFLPGHANGYEIWSVSPSALYTVYLEILDVREDAVAVFGPVHCQTPGPPSSPWIWCRTLSPYQITIEWNEPVIYGDVTIQGYQVYLNDRRLEKVVDRKQRRVTIHCQSSSVYRVSVVALGSDPQYDTADHYVIKWSSVLRPQVQELTLPLIQTCHVIDDCSPGTNHFVVVAAVDAGGDLVSRSEQCTVQTCAPVNQPSLQLRTCLQSGITIEWRKPTTFGDAEIDYYQLMVNGEPETELDADCGDYKFTHCQPCDQYTFLLKAISTKPTCDSDWSEPLVVTCPGAEKPLIIRIQSEQVNCIRVGWETPLLKGETKVESYKVYYLEDKGNNVTSEDVITDAQSIQHGPLSRHTEEDKLMHVPPDPYYWVVLQVELSTEGCKPVCSQPIRTRAAVSPDPPLISLEVEGLDERRRLEQSICELSIKRDRLHRIVHLLENKVVVKGSKQKDLQIANATDAMLEVDSELADTLEDIKEYTG
ncbi:hypothetical protein OS493_031742 [Desmophyllum pertusum]|uniref:Fibronectin type-III domain-containing protein n=1 Tax=Desmophyllum pertusum TaxID=174260 RepID=A0A9W9ZJM8_9CNID|nr:hypothetical protein OS493_031742 [Desmophyllum pertusum]